MRWVRPEGMHLTLSFIGNVEQENLETLGKIIVDATKNTVPFRLNFAGCGVFPTQEKARVVWVGTDQGTTELKKIRNALDQQLTAIGFVQDSRPFKPHLTLGRIRYPLDPEVIGQFLEREALFQTDTEWIKNIILFESRLTAQGAHYNPLQVHDFQR